MRNQTRPRFCLLALLVLSITLIVSAAGCSVFSKNRFHDPYLDAFDEELEDASLYRGQAPGTAAYSPAPQTFAIPDGYSSPFDTGAVISPVTATEAPRVASSADPFSPYAPVANPAPTISQTTPMAAPSGPFGYDPSPTQVPTSAPVQNSPQAVIPRPGPYEQPYQQPAGYQPITALPVSDPGFPQPNPYQAQPSPLQMTVAVSPDSPFGSHFVNESPQPQPNDGFSQAINVTNPQSTPQPVPPMLDPADFAPSDNDPFMPQPVRRPGTLDAPLPHSSMAAAAPGNYGGLQTDIWGVGPSEAAIRNAVSIEEAAKREEAAAAERTRRREMAQAQPTTPGKEILKPMEPWNGAFASREKKKDIEQEIILRVGHFEQNDYIPREGYENFPVYDWEKEQEKGFDWSVLDPVVFFTRVRDMVGLGPDEKKANEAMLKGRQVMLSVPDMKNEKKLLEAAKLFDTAASRWPDSVLEEDALHLAAECYFFSGHYPKAMLKYEALAVKYQHSKHVDNAVRRLFVMGRYWEQEDFRGASFYNYRWDKTRPSFGTFSSAKKAFETIFMNDPNGPIADDAVMALASAYYDRGRYQGDPNFDQAAYYFGFLRENYPLSKHIAKAHEYELYARASSYLGAENSNKALNEADKLATVTLRQHEGELDSKSREEIVALQNSLVDRQAEREWTMGKFYDRKQYFGTAKIYYEKIITKYPQTEYAEKAHKRLEQIRDKPDQPEQFGFIKKFFQARGSY